MTEQCPQTCKRCTDAVVQPTAPPAVTLHSNVHPTKPPAAATHPNADLSTSSSTASSAPSSTSKSIQLFFNQLVSALSLVQVVLISWTRERECQIVQDVFNCVTIRYISLWWLSSAHVGATDVLIQNNSIRHPVLDQLQRRPFPLQLHQYLCTSSSKLSFFLRSPIAWFELLKAFASLGCMDLINPQTGVPDCPMRATLCRDSRYLILMQHQCPRTCGFCS